MDVVSTTVTICLGMASRCYAKTVLCIRFKTDIKISEYHHTQQLSQTFPSFSTKLIMAQVKFLNSGIALKEHE